MSLWFHLLQERLAHEVLVAVVDDDDAAAPPHRQPRVAQQKINEQRLGLFRRRRALADPAPRGVGDRLRDRRPAPEAVAQDGQTGWKSNIGLGAPIGILLIN